MSAPYGRFRVTGWRYLHSGLTVVSDLSLPEWSVFAVAGNDAADVAIALEHGPAPPAPPGAATRVEGAAVSFAVAGSGHWTIRGGDRIAVRPEPGATPEDVRPFTLGSAWAAIGYARGWPLWHGAAVTLGGGAVLIAGPAGAGKSTLAAALCARGAALVADDLSRIEPVGGGATIHPSASRLKLCDDAAARMALPLLGGGATAAGKLLCRPTRTLAGGPPVPLRAIVLLAAGAETRLDPLTGAGAVAAVIAATTYRPEMLEAMGRLGEQAILAARVCAAVPVWRLTRPKTVDAEPEAASLVEELLL